MGSKTETKKKTTETPKQRATLDQLKKKPAVEREVSIGMPGDDGEVIEFSILFRAISPTRYDELRGEHPPTPAQRKDGLNFNPDTFQAALVAECSADPKLTEEDAKELWDSGNWNKGELQALFLGAVQVCSQGHDIPFSGTD